MQYYVPQASVRAADAGNWCSGPVVRCPCCAPQVQRCTLLSIKTGGCPETCTYCSQSSSWSKSTGMKAEKLMDLEEVYQVSLLCCCPPRHCYC